MYNLNLETKIHPETISNPETAPTQPIEIAETTEETLVDIEGEITRKTADILSFENKLKEVETTNQDLENQKSNKNKEAGVIMADFQSGIEQLPSAGKKTA